MPWVLTGSRDASIKVWSTRSWRCVRTMSAPGVRCLNLISAERLLLVGLDSGEIQWWKQGRDSELLAPLAAPSPKPRMNLAWEDELAICVYTYTYTYTYVYSCMYTHTYTYAYAYIYYVHMHTHIIHMQTQNELGVKGSLDVSDLCESAYVRMYVYISTWIHVCINVRTYIHRERER